MQHSNVNSKTPVTYTIAIFTRTPCKLRILARATIILELYIEKISAPKAYLGLM